MATLGFKVRYAEQMSGIYIPNKPGGQQLGKAKIDNPQLGFFLPQLSNSGKGLF